MKSLALRTRPARFRPLGFWHGVQSVATIDMNSPLVFIAPSDDPWVPLNRDWQAIGRDLADARRELEARNGSSKRAAELVA